VAILPGPEYRDRGWPRVTHASSARWARAPGSGRSSRCSRWEPLVAPAPHRGGTRRVPLIIRS